MCRSLLLHPKRMKPSRSSCRKANPAIRAAAIKALDRAMTDFRDNLYDVLITAPINNQNAQIDAMTAEIRALTGMVQEQQQQLQRLTTRAIRQIDEPSSKEQSRTQEESLAGIASHIRDVKKVKQMGIF